MTLKYLFSLFFGLVLNFYFDLSHAGGLTTFPPPNTSYPQIERPFYVSFQV
jgi:hypothetical protein